jgi:predicted transcriptional regulator of viral defense system
MKFEDQIREFEGQPLNRQILMDMLKDYKRPYDKINELVKKEALIPVRKGIFVPGPALHLASPEPFLLANHLKGPSYISMETALSYWGLIPEKVFEVTSATVGRSETYDTLTGRFRYAHLPLPYYAFGQQQVTLAENQVALVATAEKALCDKIITTSGLLFRSVIQLKAWLIEDMRMEKDMLRRLQPRLIHSWLNKAPKKHSLQLLVKILDDL